MLVDLEVYGLHTGHPVEKLPEKLKDQCVDVVELAARSLDLWCEPLEDGREVLDRLFMMMHKHRSKTRRMSVAQLRELVGEDRDCAAKFVKRDDAENVITWARLLLTRLHDREFDYQFVSPIAVDMTLRVTDGLSLPRMDAQTESHFVFGRCPRMEQVDRQIDQYAPPEVTVLIQGESGVGKDIVARELHHRGNNSLQGPAPYHAINCGALPETLLESELFGHRKGAFTGADRDRIGLFEAADRGTLFLDEIGDMPLSVQAHLLRMMENGMVRRLGDNRERGPFGVKIVAATHRDLVSMVQDGTFREDLFFRLFGAMITVPPWRLREDKDTVLDWLTEREAGGVEMTPEARTFLMEHPMPGNIRSLKKIVQVSAAEAGQGRILPKHLTPKLALLNRLSTSISPTELAASTTLLQLNSGVLNGTTFTSVIDVTDGLKRAKDLFTGALATAAENKIGNQQDAADWLKANRTTVYKSKKRISNGKLKT